MTTDTDHDPQKQPDIADGNNEKNVDTKDKSAAAGAGSTEKTAAPFLIDTKEDAEQQKDADGDQKQQQEQQVVKKVVPPLPLDWTKMAECNEGDEGENISPADAIRYPWDVMELPLPPTTPKRIWPLWARPDKRLHVWDVIYMNIYRVIWHILYYDHI